ncbi:MAG: exo-alpha-sialidase [Firmicutes bacterium]|nr:exo-alpha-sialidase [Candidatus Fermentithermobacillaceae bacterium]
MVVQRNLFVSGAEGYHTYRIPALAVTGQGTVLAFCEGRKHSPADTGDIDILLKRSFDGGRTWEATQVVVAGGGHTAGNPAPVVDRDTGTILLLFCRNNIDGPEKVIIEGKAPRTVWLTKSDDDGATWSEPVEITSSVKRPEWTWYATGPCHGVQLASGRLVVPCDHVVLTEKASTEYPFYSHVIYSDDHGLTWHIGGILGPCVNESVVVELKESLYINCRGSHVETYRRGYAHSYDGGLTFTELAWDEALVEPRCQGSAIAAEVSGKSYVLFSNPASTERKQMTIKLSDDECRTWHHGVLLNEGPSAYSDLCVLSDGTVLSLYERGEATPYEYLTLATMNLADLVKGCA